MAKTLDNGKKQKTIHLPEAVDERIRYLAFKADKSPKKIMEDIICEAIYDGMAAETN